jgi:putative phosphoesterase
VKQIGILSDTHGYIPPNLYDFFSNCHEIWHAGDWGSLELVQQLRAFKPLKTVYGNIDGPSIRQEMPEILTFEIEKLSVCILHIGGYPGKYSPLFKKTVVNQHFDLMVCGHSHVLKAMKDPVTGMMHLNPGAAGVHGFHSVSTAMRLKMEHKRMFDLEIWECPKGTS